MNLQVNPGGGGGGCGCSGRHVCCSSYSGGLGWGVFSPESVYIVDVWMDDAWMDGVVEFVNFLELLYALSRGVGLAGPPTQP